MLAPSLSRGSVFTQAPADVIQYVFFLSIALTASLPIQDRTLTRRWRERKGAADREDASDDDEEDEEELALQERMNTTLSRGLLFIRPPGCTMEW